MADAFIAATLLRGIKRRAEAAASKPARPARRLPIHFLEENVSEETLSQAALVRFPGTVFLAAPDLAGFQQGRAALRRANADLRPAGGSSPPGG